jgi:hypothetical protein
MSPVLPIPVRLDPAFSFAEQQNQLLAVFWKRGLSFWENSLGENGHGPSSGRFRITGWYLIHDAPNYSM